MGCRGILGEEKRWRYNVSVCSVEGSEEGRGGKGQRVSPRAAPVPPQSSPPGIHCAGVSEAGVREERQRELCSLGASMLTFSLDVVQALIILIRSIGRHRCQPSVP